MNFVRRFQQVTGPVMAKGVEDTAFYVFNRLVSLNEVGGDPSVFVTRPISAAFIMATLLILVVMVAPAVRKRREAFTD